MLPSCIISALWHNEKLSLTNTLGRIPIFGYFHDTFVNVYNVLKDEDTTSIQWNEHNK